MNVRIPDWFLALVIVGFAGFTFGYVPHQWMIQLQQQVGTQLPLPWFYYSPYIFGILAILLAIVIWRSLVWHYLQLENKYHIRPSMNTIVMTSILIPTIVFGLVPCALMYHIHKQPAAKKQISYLAYNGACFTSSLQLPLRPVNANAPHYAIQCGDRGNARLFFIDPSDFKGSDGILRYPDTPFHCEISTNGEAICDASTIPRSDP